MKPRILHFCTSNRRRFFKASPLVQIFILAALLFCSSVPGIAQGPGNEQAPSINLMTWNICGRACYHGDTNMEPIAQVIKNANAEVIALQEINLAQAIWLAYYMGYNSREEVLDHLLFVQTRDFGPLNLNTKDPKLKLPPKMGFRNSDFVGLNSPLGGAPVDFGNAIITSRQYPIENPRRYRIASSTDNPPVETVRSPAVSVHVGNTLLRIYSMHTASIACTGGNPSKCKAKLKEALYQAGRIIRIVNTEEREHLDEKGNQLFYPILMGDFNMDFDSPPYRVLSTRFLDVWYLWDIHWQPVHPGESLDGTTTKHLSCSLFQNANDPVLCGGKGGGTQLCCQARIDYIFADIKSIVSVAQAKVLRTETNIAPLSDHYPIFATLYITGIAPAT